MSSKNSSKLNVPEAKAAMDKFKMEAASEVGVNLKTRSAMLCLPASSRSLMLEYSRLCSL